ncbi:MAG: alcohol dehydrogenase AdhP [Mycoplasmataceae bacterium]|nr:alcohol dehydrogenase AdhP [Mycoplasmataceae bacterium]
MKAFLVEAPGKWSVKEVNVPKPKKGEVLIKMETSGVCHTDLHAANFDWPVEPKFPLIPGHEGIGLVAELGEGVTEHKIGDRVALAWLHDTCGECEYCLNTDKDNMETLCPNQNMTAYTVDGSFGEYAIGNSKFIAKVPEGLDILSGAPVVCAGVTTYKAVKRANVKPGGWITVIGIGGLGQLAVQYAKALGYKVIAVDIQDEKIELALNSGADFAVNSLKEDAIAFVKEKTGGLGTHGAINTSISQVAFNSSFEMLRPGGRSVLVGLPSKVGGGDQMTVPIFFTVLQGKEVVGSIVGTRKDLKEALQFAADGKVKSKITKVIKLEEVEDMFKALEEGTFVGRAVIDYRK